MSLQPGSAVGSPVWQAVAGADNPYKSPNSVFLGESPISDHREGFRRIATNCP